MDNPKNKTPMTLIQKMLEINSQIKGVRIYASSGSSPEEGAPDGAVDLKIRKCPFSHSGGSRNPGT
jgi:hypothetical protein